MLLCILTKWSLATIAVVSTILVFIIFYQLKQFLCDFLLIVRFNFKHNSKNQTVDLIDDYSSRFGPELPNVGLKVSKFESKAT